MKPFLLSSGGGHPGRVLRRFLSGLLLVLCCAGTPLMAQPVPVDGPETDQATLEAEAPGPVTRKQALDRVRYRFPGEVISISEVEDGNRVRYRFRMDDNGNIFTIYVDRDTGVVSRD